VKLQLASQIAAYDRPVFIQGTMIEGAFKFMQHDHFFAKMAPNITEMKDHFVFEAPFSVLGLIAETLLLRPYMTNLLSHRNGILKEVAESDRWAVLLPPD
jgi:hypothetical protein